MTASSEAVQQVGIIARAASDKLATDLVALDVSENLPLADVFFLCSARNERMVQAIAESIDEAMTMAGSPRLRQEGRAEGRWIVMDFGNVIAHVFHEEERLYYQLERLWKDCPIVPLPEMEAPTGDA